MKWRFLLLSVLSIKAFCSEIGHNDRINRAPPITDPITERITPLLEFKAGYFFFVDSTLRKIYGSGGVDIQLSGSYPLKYWSPRYALEFYGSMEYLYAPGHSLNFRQKTSIWELPLNIGLRSVFGINEKTHYYLALGPRYFYVHQHNDSSYVKETISRSGIGMFLNTGFHFIPLDHFLIDIFGEYSYTQSRFRPARTNVYGQKIQVGGFTFGLGFGYSF